MSWASWRGAVLRYARRIRALLVDDATVVIALMLMTLVVSGLVGLLVVGWLETWGLWDEFDRGPDR
jgi:hypothetical protein